MLILYMDRKIQSLQGPQRTKNKLLKGILKLDFLIESYFLKKNYSLYISCQAGLSATFFSCLRNICPRAISIYTLSVIQLLVSFVIDSN